MESTMQLRHILEAQQFDKKMLRELFALAEKRVETTFSEVRFPEASSTSQASGPDFLSNPQ